MQLDNNSRDDDDDEFRFNDASTHEGHLRQNGELTWFCNETIIMISHKCIKCKTRTKIIAEKSRSLSVVA